MTTTKYARVGETFTLPDGPTVIVTAIDSGVEFGMPVQYVTGTNSLGQSVTRWIPAPSFVGYRGGE